ncbi:ACP synthase [Paraburkholderia sp. EG287B]|uniref:ACP synthase n=1 Tax=Paraburkholderia sp. EG287B TaxID=3237010 RepID=UPI0034D2FEDB
MKRASTLGWQPATTYAEMVSQERRDLEARLKRLAQARKLIVALEPDLQRLRDKNVNFNVDGRFGLIVDCREDVLIGRAVNALRLDTGISDASGDRAVRALLDLGYVIERRHGDPRWPSAILRRPKTQIRPIVRCTPAGLATLLESEAA